VTVPLSGGRSFTLAPGAAPVLLTQYAPGADDGGLLIINLDVSAGRLYLGGDSSVSPNNGVPVDPGTAIPWTTAGQVWAVADPAAAANLTVVVTAAISTWTPSPAAIAAEVAAGLLASGVPNVLLEDQLGGGVVAAGGNLSFDVSKYASAQISIAALGPPATLLFQQLAPGGGIIWQDLIPVTANVVGLVGDVESLVQLVGATLRIYNLAGGGNVSIGVSASNRATPTRFDTRNLSANGDTWNLPTQAMVVGGNYDLIQDRPAGAFGAAPPRVQGQCWAQVLLGGQVVLGQLVITDGTSEVLWVCDTSEMHAIPSGNQRIIGRMIAVPPGYSKVTFQCRGTGGASAAVTLKLVPCQL
jgi:hypothetical protein